MKSESRRIALCSMMVALGVIVMMLGGVIPVMTFCSPAIAGLTLLPVLSEYGKKWALAAWAAISAQFSSLSGVEAPRWGVRITPGRSTSSSTAKSDI